MDSLNFNRVCSHIVRIVQVSLPSPFHSLNGLIMIFWMKEKKQKIKMDQKSQNKPSFLGQKTDLPRDIVITESLKNQYISFSAHLRVRVYCFATHPPSLSTNSTPKSCYSFNSRENGHRRFLSANS